MISAAVMSILLFPHNSMKSLVLMLESVFPFLAAAKILPVVKNQHLLLVTLLVCNAAAMEVMFKTSPCPLLCDRS